MDTQAAAAANDAGLAAFAAADPKQAEHFLKQAYQGWADELGILVNLGLALMQQGLPAIAERCYRLALQSSDTRTRRAACKNLGFLHLWRGEWSEGWHWHSQRFQGEPFLKSQWQGDALNGKPLVVWNDVGMGDAFQFVRYTKPLVDNGEKVILAVHSSQIELFQQQLSWRLHGVVDRAHVQFDTGPHVPLMSLISLVDPTTAWGRNWEAPTWLPPTTAQNQNEQDALAGLCWASNPGDQTMHRYKSCSPNLLIELARETSSGCLSLQTDEDEAHRRLHLLPQPRCWLKTLERIQLCREIISVDTAVAHLAAGSGKPVRMVLPQVADWRWEGGPNWYPTIKLTRRMATDPMPTSKAQNPL
jgi:hypothetical protein